ncbi:Translin-associated protein X [Tolypocladium paradoxum]|uniref:Translin-associated protein X n=1 Tax=Tolypocladium paradoxum TaxID=94208 RepID=A0A2S4KRQ6_9HYPO|nr:Translin-associated protein X [Tolypocladium paradoxum]
MSAGSKRDRDGNTRAKTAPDAPRGRFHGMFEQFRDELDEHHDRRERIVKASRDVTAHSKKIRVQHLRPAKVTFAAEASQTRGSPSSSARVKTLNQEFPPHTQKDMDTRMADVTKLLQSTAPDLGSINRHRYTWQLRCLEELVEALSFAHYLRHQTLMTPAEAQAALPADVALTAHDYAHGVLDLFGELMRFATVQRGEVLGAGDDGGGGRRTILRDMQALGCAFEMLPEVPGREFRGKMDVMRQSVRKVEKLGYGLVVRGSERPSGWVPDVKDEAREAVEPV